MRRIALPFAGPSDEAAAEAFVACFRDRIYLYIYAFPFAGPSEEAAAVVAWVGVCACA